jgi:hypothetical protein
MKKLLIIIFLIIVVGKNFAQITVNFIMNGTPPAKLVEWSSKPGTATLVVNNNTQQPRVVKIRTELKSADGSTTIAVTNPQQMRLITLNTGNNIFQANDVLPLQALEFLSSTALNTYLKTGKLVQGNYQICVRLDSAGLPIPITGTQCRVIQLTGIQLPVLIAPQHETLLNPIEAQNAIIFRWTNALRASAELPIYQLEVYEILPTQQPVQALRSNQPILVTTVKGTTQYIWRPQLLFNDSVTHRFIWTIRTTDAQGNLFSTTDGNEEGRSEPKIFMIGHTYPSKKRKQ